MDLAPEKLPGGTSLLAGIGGTVLLIVGFLGRWLWERLWRKSDDRTRADGEKDKAMSAAIAEHARQISQLTERVDSFRTLKDDHHRLVGKVDELQTAWRGEFAKMGDRFRELEEKVDYKLDNFRMELRGDQQRFEERIIELLTAHQGRVHDRINILASEQAKGLNDLLDQLVERIADPRPSPAKPPRGSGNPT